MNTINPNERASRIDSCPALAAYEAYLVAHVAFGQIHKIWEEKDGRAVEWTPELKAAQSARDEAINGLVEAKAATVNGALCKAIYLAEYLEDGTPLYAHEMAKSLETDLERLSILENAAPEVSIPTTASNRPAWWGKVDECLVKLDGIAASLCVVREGFSKAFYTTDEGRALGYLSNAVYFAHQEADAAFYTENRGVHDDMDENKVVGAIVEAFDYAEAIRSIFEESHHCEDNDRTLSGIVYTLACDGVNVCRKAQAAIEGVQR